MRYYAYYPTDPAALRTMAGEARKSGKAVHDVSGIVAQQHEKAVSAADGELVTNFSALLKPTNKDAAQVNRTAIWAGLQVERFCDAIERYNNTSADPMSISRLNARVQEIIAAGGVAEADCLPATPASTDIQDLVTTNPITDPPDLEAAEQRRLDGEQRRLEAELDAAARSVATAIDTGPTDGAILRAWQNGNLPAWAALAWPELDLTKVPIKGVSTDLLEVEADDFPDILSDPEDPRTDEELEWLWLNFPEEMQQFADDWDPKDHIIPAGHSPEGMDSDDGWIQGPDGRWYPVEVPYGPADNTQTIHNNGWTNLYSHLTDIELGQDLAVLLPLGPPPQIGPQPVQDDQTNYWAIDANGNLVNAGGPEAPTGTIKPQPGGPYPETARESGDLDDVLGPNPRLDKFQRMGARLDLAIVAGENVLYNQQLAANNEYAGNFVFQETPDGETRVVIDLGQAMVDGSGNDSYKRIFGILTEQGTFDEAPLKE